MSSITYDLEFRHKAQADAPENAEEVVAEIKRIAARNAGRITPEAVVAEAQNPKSPLYRHFEHDPGEGLYKWQLEQARALIASVRVHLTGAPKDATPIRAFVHVARGREHYYQDSADAMQDPATRQSVLNRALTELRQFERRYAELEELAEIFDVSRRVRREIKGDDDGIEARI